jgi:hypothetical protein
LVAVVLLLLIILGRSWRGRPARTVAGAGTGAQAGAQPGAGAGAGAQAQAKSAPHTNVTVLTQYDLWMRRVEREQLGARDDDWADLSRTAQYATWRRLAEARGAGDDVPRYMTHSLLSEVIYAAGGVEREFQQLCRALAGARRPAGEAALRSSGSAAWVTPQEEVIRPGRPAIPGRAISRASGAATPMREASYCFVDLLGWARSTVERTDRPYRPGSAERAGLVPALAEGPLRDGVAAALQQLRAALRDSRFVASYALHAGAMAGEGTPDGPGAEILPDGRVLARLAEPVADPVLTWEGLTFTEARDMLSYATELMAAVEVFVSRVLDAFAASSRRPAVVTQRGGVGHPRTGE